MHVTLEGEAVFRVCTFWTQSGDDNDCFYYCQK